MDSVEALVDFLPRKIRVRLRKVLEAASEAQGRDETHLVQALLSYASQQLEQHLLRSHYVQGVGSSSELAGNEGNDDAFRGSETPRELQLFGGRVQRTVVPMGVIVRLTDAARAVRSVMAQPTLRDAAEEAGFFVLTATGVHVSRRVPLMAQLWLRAIRFLADAAGCEVSIPQLEGAPATPVSVPRPLGAAGAPKGPLAAVVVSYKYRAALRDAHRQWRARQLMHNSVDLRPFDARVRLLGGLDGEGDDAFASAGEGTEEAADAAARGRYSVHKYLLDAPAATPAGCLCENPSAEQQATAATADEPDPSPPWPGTASEAAAPAKRRARRRNRDGDAGGGAAAPRRGREAPPRPAGGGCTSPRSPHSYPVTPQARALALASTGSTTDGVLARARDALREAVRDAYGAAAAEAVLPASRAGAAGGAGGAATAAAAAAAAARGATLGDLRFAPAWSHPRTRFSTCRRFVCRADGGEGEAGAGGSPGRGAAVAEGAREGGAARRVAMLPAAPQATHPASLPVARSEGSFASAEAEESTPPRLRPSVRVGGELADEAGPSEAPAPCPAAASLRRNAGAPSLSALRATAEAGGAPARLGTRLAAAGPGSPWRTGGGAERPSLGAAARSFSSGSLGGSSVGLCLSPPPPPAPTAAASARAPAWGGAAPLAAPPSLLQSSPLAVAADSGGGGGGGGGGSGSAHAVVATSADLVSSDTAAPLPAAPRTWRLGGGAGAQGAGPRFATAQCGAPLPAGRWAYFEFSVWPRTAPPHEGRAGAEAAPALRAGRGTVAVGLAPAATSAAAMAGTRGASVALCSSGHVVAGGCWEGAPCSTFGQAPGDVVGVAALLGPHGGLRVRFAVNGVPVHRYGRGIRFASPAGGAAAAGAGKGGLGWVDTVAVAAPAGASPLRGEEWALVPSASLERGSDASVECCLAAHEFSQCPYATFGDPPGDGGRGYVSLDGVEL